MLQKILLRTTRTLIWLTLVNCSSISISPFFFLICFENPNHSSNIRTAINKIVIFAKKRNRNYEINRKYIKKKSVKKNGQSRYIWIIVWKRSNPPLHFIFDNLSPYPSISIHLFFPFSSRFHIDSIHRP